MYNKLNDTITRLMGLRYRSHPWHGIEVGKEAPQVITAFIEMVPTDTVKYELNKVNGFLCIDRPQRYSNVVPALYGFIPQSYCGERASPSTAWTSSSERISWATMTLWTSVS